MLCVIMEIVQMEGFQNCIITQISKIQGLTTESPAYCIPKTQTHKYNFDTFKIGGFCLDINILLPKMSLKAVDGCLA